VTVSGLLVVRAPLRYVDPTGHEEKLLGTVTLTPEQLEDLIDLLLDLQLFVETIGGGGSVLLGVFSAIAGQIYLTAVFAILAFFSVVDAAQLAWLIDYLEDALRHANGQDVTIEVWWWWDNSQLWSMYGVWIWAKNLDTLAWVGSGASLYALFAIFDPQGVRDFMDQIQDALP